MKANKRIGTVVLVVVICMAITAVYLTDTEICDWCGKTIFKEIYTDLYGAQLCENCAREYWIGWPGDFENMKIGEVDNTARNTLMVLEIIVGAIIIWVSCLQGRKEHKEDENATKNNLGAGISAVKESARAMRRLIWAWRSFSWQRPVRLTIRRCCLLWRCSFC